MFSVVFSEVSGSDIILVNDDVSVQLHNRHVHSYIDMDNLDTQDITHNNLPSTGFLQLTMSTKEAVITLTPTVLIFSTCTNSIKVAICIISLII